MANKILTAFYLFSIICVAIGIILKTIRGDGMGALVGTAFLGFNCLCLVNCLERQRARHR